MSKIVFVGSCINEYCGQAQLIWPRIWQSLLELFARFLRSCRDQGRDLPNTNLVELESYQKNLIFGFFPVVEHLAFL